MDLVNLKSYQTRLTTQLQHGACHPIYAEHLKEGLLNQSCISQKFRSGENKNQRLQGKTERLSYPGNRYMLFA